MKLCTIHASGVFSLFSALAFATRNYNVDKIVFFDRKNTFSSRSDFLKRCEPVLRFFDITEIALIYVTRNDQVEYNFSDIYTLEGSRILFAESLQSPDNQKLIRLISPKELHFYAEGAMSYGPIRGGLPSDLTRVMKGVHYVDYGNGLPPISIEQFGAKDYGLSSHEFRVILESFFTLLDENYRDLTQVDGFLASIPPNSVALVHQNLSAIAGFESESERAIFRSIQSQIMASWSGPLVVFMHPKGERDVTDIFDADPQGQPKPLFVSPVFPFAEYYISRMKAELTAGIFSTSLLNLHCLNLPVLTMETHYIGRTIKSAFDSNLYALHYIQLVLGAYEHEGSMYPSMKIYSLRQRLAENTFVRCSVKNEKLWRLPYYIGDTAVLERNIIQAKVDMEALKPYHKMPAFRRLSKGRKQMLADHGLSANAAKRKALRRWGTDAYHLVKRTLGLLQKGRQ